MVVLISYGENWYVCKDKEISGTKMSYGSVEYLMEKTGTLVKIRRFLVVR